MGAAEVGQPEAQRGPVRRAGGPCSRKATVLGYLTQRCGLQPQKPLQAGDTGAMSGQSGSHPSLRSASKVAPPLLFTMNTPGL